MCRVSSRSEETWGSGGNFFDNWSNQLFYYQFAPHLLRLRCFLLFPFFVFCTTKKTRDRPFVPKDTALICVLGSDRNVQEKHQKPSVRLCPVSYLYEFCTFFSEKERFEDVQGSGSETYSRVKPLQKSAYDPPETREQGPEVRVSISSCQTCSSSGQ